VRVTAAAAPGPELASCDAVIVGSEVDGQATLAVAEQIAAQAPQLPILWYAPKSPVKKEEENLLRRLSNSTRLRHVQSPERLLDETMLALHRPMTSLPRDRRAAIETLYDNDAVLAGRKVLIVDDDIRNIFALTSVLEREQMAVLSAENGRAAIEILQATPDVDVVLMDIMMPGMDGYDTMRAIRKMAKFRHLPIVAVTAKAMKGDREKTIEAGAWDYLSKPVDSAQMLGVLRAWLRR
jgi:CheY-like chemotaxis protein